MPTNHRVLIGDFGQNIPQTTGSAEVPLPDFDTSRRQTDEGAAVLMYSVRGLNGTADVFINNNLAGTITASSGSVFSTQVIAAPANQLNDGNNNIVMRNVTDPFTIKDVICFFHQSS